ncbi:MAG: AbrB/MazE/SpoVT family DNA-binding domain-containing protein [Desulfovibrionaceae bacterium]|nr:AbrB/MazE/SpoVT family DNA-binding domain-containing protein [Desulfovibrionaceae bacterium]
MTVVTLSSRGQLVLPAEVRRRFGLTTGSQLELTEEVDGLRLAVPHRRSAKNVESGYGMIAVRPSGKPRSLMDFDAASLLAKGGRGGKQP